MHNRLNYVRFILAWCVLAYHMNFFKFPLAGPLAVWGFFFISGYLVSRILCVQYRDRPRDFLTNRFLRLFPTYWVALAIGLVICLVDPVGIFAISRKMFIPDSYSAWVGNVFIFGIPESPRIVVPAWSLALELHWYLIFFVGSFLPRKWLLIFLYLNLLLPFLIMYVWQASIYEMGTGFAFSLGAIAYHSNASVPRGLQLVALGLIPLLLFVVPLYFGLSGLGMKEQAVNYSLLGIALLLFMALPWLLEDSSPSSMASLAGELSYPIFLTHQFAGWIAMRWFNVSLHSWSMLFSATLICLLLSLVIVRLVEHPVAIVRSRIRNRDLPARPQ